MKLPKGRDPDEIIRADPDGWRRFVIEAEAPKAFSSARIQSTPTEHGQRTAKARRSAGTGDEERIDVSKGEETCLALLIRYPQLRGQGLALDEELFVRTENRQVFAAWKASEPERLEETLAAELRPHLEQIASRDLPFDPPQVEKALQTCAEHLKRSKIKIERAFISLEIAEKEQRLGAGRFVEQARKLIAGEAPSQDLPEDDTDDARIVVREVEAGLELHERKA
jgi:hypothetical protein